MRAAQAQERALDAMAIAAGEARLSAHAELKAGQKQGHWIWYVFPTLRARGGDMFSMMQNPAADLQDLQMAQAYATHAKLRPQLLESFTIASSAFAAAAAAGKTKVPWQVLDAGFNRSAEGAWLKGPVDSFKVFCCATMFAAVAHKAGDDELRIASLAVLDHFKGDVIYYADKKGSSGYRDDAPDEKKNVLMGYDEPTLRLMGGAEWEAIKAGK